MRSSMVIVIACAINLSCFSMSWAQDYRTARERNLQALINHLENPACSYPEEAKMLLIKARRELQVQTRLRHRHESERARHTGEAAREQPVSSSGVDCSECQESLRIAE
jgi:hypothetical protein